MKKLVVLASGQGSNFQAIIDGKEQYNGKIVALIVDRECYAIKRAEENNIPVIRVIRARCKNKKDFNTKLLDTLTSLEADYFILAGFMSILSKETVEAFPNRILNIHPSLLPAFPGTNAIKQAVDYGVKYTGCTIHFVDEGMDTGPIIEQGIIAVEDHDGIESLTKEIHKLEHKLYIKVLILLCADSITVAGRKVKKNLEEKFNEN